MQPHMPVQLWRVLYDCMQLTGITPFSAQTVCSVSPLHSSVVEKQTLPWPAAVSPCSVWSLLVQPRVSEEQHGKSTAFSASY